MNRVFIIILAATCLLLPGVQCTRQATDVAGGSTSTNNARVAGTIIDNNGLPAANASVLLRDIVVTENGDSLTNEWHSTTNLGGNFFFDAVPTGNYVLLSYDSEMRTAGFATRFAVAGDTIAQLALSALHVLKGRVVAGPSVDVHSIVVSAAGTVSPVHPDPQGFYTLSGVPQSQYDIIFVHDSVVNYLPLEMLSCARDTLYIRDAYFTNYNAVPYSYFGTTLSAAFALEPAVYAPGSEPAWYNGTDFSFIRYFVAAGKALNEISSDGTPAILLDDFDDGDNFSFLNSVTGKATWYAYNDKSFGGNSIVLPEGATNAFSLAITDSAAFSGKSARICAILNHQIKAPYSGIALDLESGTTAAANLTAMQSFSFMLKGRGQIRVIFWTRLGTAAYPDSQVWGQFGTTLQCPPTWTKTVILPQDIATPPGSKQRADSLKWQDAATSVFRIEFSTWQNPVDTIQIGIDQVYINGVPESVFR